MYWKEVSSVLLWLGQTHAQTHLHVVWTQLGYHGVSLGHLPTASPSPAPHPLSCCPKWDVFGFWGPSLGRCDVPRRQPEFGQWYTVQATVQAIPDGWRWHQSMARAPGLGLGMGVLMPAGFPGKSLKTHISRKSAFFQIWGQNNHPLSQTPEGVFTKETQNGRNLVQRLHFMEKNEPKWPQTPSQGLYPQQTENTEAAQLHCWELGLPGASGMWGQLGGEENKSISSVLKNK